MQTSFAVVFVIAALASACQTQDHPPGKKPAGPPFVLEAGEVKVADLIDKGAAYLQWNILVTEQELSMASTQQGAFKLQRRIETDHEGCEDLLTSMLSTRNLAVIPLDESKQIFEVISTQGPRMREVTTRALQRTPEQILARPNLRMPVLTVVKLEHTNATIATNALRPFFASTGSPQGGGSLTLGNVGNNSAMLLQGMQDQVAAALVLLKAADVPPPPEVAAGVAERLDKLSKRVEALEQQLAKPQGR